MKARHYVSRQLRTAKDFALRLERRMRAGVGVFAYLMLGMSPAMADDIDIYTKAVAGGAGGSPVIVFQLDSSGSMQFDVDKKEPVSNPDAANATHLLQERRFLVQDAMRGQITSLPGRYKVGIFRYSGSTSGLKLADAIPMQTVRSSTAAPPPTGGVYTYPITSGLDDVEQVSGESVRVGEWDLNMTRQWSGGGWNIVASPYSSSWTSSTGSTLPGAIAEPNGNQFFWYYHTSPSDTLTITLDSATVDTYLFALNSSNVVIAQNDDRQPATTYVCPTGWGSPILTTTPPTCRRYCSTQDVNNGVPGCTQKNKWNTINATPVSPNTNSTITLTGMTQYTWYRFVAATKTPGQAGNFTLRLSDGTAGNLWAMSNASGLLKEQRVGLRFTGITIPKGATINKAYLEFASNGDQTSVTQLIPGIDKSGSPKDFSAQGLFSRDMEWGSTQIMPDWSYGEVSNDTRLDVTGLVDNHVDSSDWCGGDMVFVVRGSGGGLDERIAASYENSLAEPKLVVDWTPGAASDGCYKKDYTFKVQTMTEDVYQKTDGTISFNENFISVGGSEKAGLRFTLMNVPGSVTVETARLQVVADTTGTPQPIEIRAITDALAKPFGAKVSSLSARQVSDAVVTWTPPSWVAGQTYTSPELKNLLAPQINGAGWEYHGAVGFILSGTQAGSMKIRAWDRTASGAESLNRNDFGQYAATLNLRVRSTSPINEMITHRSFLQSQVDSLLASGGTPISGAYLELAQYLLGRDGYTMPQMASGACANNSAIVLTDGFEEATYSKTTFPADVKTITGKSCSVTGTPSGFVEAWPCTYNMMDALYEPEKFGAVSADGNYYSVRTHTVGFGPIAQQGGGKLNASGVHGGGDYYPAANAAALIDIFNEIIASIVDAGATIAAPGVAVNALNKFEHLDELYYSLFKPSTKVDWKGNIKRYRLKDSVIVDVNGNPAIDNVASIFEVTSQSWWSVGEDGVAVTQGGAAYKITQPSTRKVYTYLGNNGTSINADLYHAGPGSCSGGCADGSGGEGIELTNANITPELLGVDLLPGYGTTMTGAQILAQRDQVLTFVRGGEDVLPTLEFGSAIHGSPTLITFRVNDKGDTDPTNDEGVNTIFVGDNRGVLHMIATGEPSSDTPATNVANSGGVELFAFVPQELLKNAALLQQNTQVVEPLGGEYIYGLDAPWVPWKRDVDGDGNIEPADGDHVYLYGGMRRGGKNVYALDVSTVYKGGSVQPRLLWVIEGGKTGTPYANMGQSWSEPSPRWIRWNGERRRVVFFGGGYDEPVHDDVQPFTSTTHKGSQVYMVDANTGELLWWASSETGATTQVADMKYSITAAPATMDRNGNGVVDGMYIVDLAGQVFRFDFNEGNTGATNLVRNNAPVVVAKLGATASGANAGLDNRRFYDMPAVAFMRTSGAGDVMIGLVSGYREAPVNDATQEMAIMFRDVGAWALTPGSNALITTASLVDATSIAELTGDDLAKPGWYINLDRTLAEKGVGSPVFFNFAMIFSTFVPKGTTSPSSCQPDIGYSRLYAMNSLTAAGIVNSDLANASANQRYVDKALPGIASTAQLLYMDGQLSLISGTLAIATDGKTGLEDDSSNLLDPSIFGKIRRTRWFTVDE